MLAFMKCVAEAVMENGVNGLASLVPGGEFAMKVAAGAYKKYSERKKEAEQRKEIEEIAKTSFESAKQEAVAAVREAAAEVARSNPQKGALSEADRLQLELYLTQIPSVVQQSLKRPEDPSGRTAPSAFAIRTPDDVTKLLPLHAPRFKPGDPVPGRSDWVLERPLGVGGFGEVWLARHDQSTSLVRAVKFCLGQQARDLQHESGLIDRVMQAGQHPNIVPLLDMALRGDTPWLMYEYVQGGDLGDWVRMLQPRSPEERCKQAVAGLRQIASAVAHFHKLTPPVVHRDLKPNNILLDRVNKRLRITDFGIGAVAAKAALDEEARGGTSAAGRMMSYMRGSHTPLYASPQQRTGSDPDPRDDVHALGVIAFQMLTGRLDAEVKGNWQKKLRTDGVPDALIDLIGDSTSDEPNDRPKDAREWGTALAAVKIEVLGPSTTGQTGLTILGGKEDSPKSGGVPPSTVVVEKPKVEIPSYELRPNALAILNALKKRGATSAETAISKYLLMAEDGVGPHCYNLEDEGLIDWVEQPKSPVPEMTKEKWTLYVTPAGVRAIENHVVDSGGIPRLTPNSLAHLKGLLKRGATKLQMAVSKELLMAEDGVTGNLDELDDQDLIACFELPRSPNPKLTKSKWVHCLTLPGIKAIDNHVLVGEPGSTRDTDAPDVWEGFWFVNVGECEWRNWDDCRKYGFLAAGWGARSSDSLKRLPLGAKVFAYMKGCGYVGYGEVTVLARVARDFTPEGTTIPLLKLPDITEGMRHSADDDEQAEWVVGVRWSKTFGREEAKRFVGAFANQNIVCKLGDPETVEYLRKEFNVPE